MRWEQCRERDLCRLGQPQHFRIGDTPDLRLDLGQSPPRNRKPLHRQLGGKLLLGQSALEAQLPQLGADDVLGCVHALKSELDIMGEPDSKCSEIRAI